MKWLSLLVLTGLSLTGCTLADRNAVARSICDRSTNCTTTDDRPPSGPPQVQAMENRRQSSATVRSKK